MKQRSWFLAMAFAIAGCTSGGVFPAGNDFNVPGGSTDPIPTPCVEQTFYLDGDKDSFGDPAKPSVACKDAPPAGHVSNMNDCNDAAPSVHPGASESCDKVDNDCNKQIDDTTKSWWLDYDGDGYGDPNPKFELQGLCNGVGNQKQYVANASDCNDTDPSVHPGAKEDCDQIDNDCNGAIDDGLKTTHYKDDDLDGHGDPKQPFLACKTSVGVVVSSDDCNDDPEKKGKSIYPGAPEACDALDNDCDGTTDEDVKIVFFKDKDDDGFGGKETVQACDAPNDATLLSGDCNDTEVHVNPNASETCNEVDDNCNGVTDEGVQTAWRQDLDKDGFANPNSKITLACSAPPGMALGLGALADCDDEDWTVYPGAPEICDGKDNACAGLPMPPKEPDALCDDGDKFTKDLCYGAKGCVWEDQKLTLSCFNPPEYPLADGYACSVSYFFGDSTAPGQFDMTIGKDSVTLFMKDVCAELKAGNTLRVNSYVQNFDPAAIWVGGYFTKMIDSFTNAAVSGVPGNVTLSWQGLDFNYGLAEFKLCQ